MATGGSKGFRQCLPSGRYRHIVTTCGRDVIAGVLEVLLLVHSSSKDFREQLKDIGIYSEFKKKYERDKIDKNEPLATYDITLLHSVCEKLWRKVSNQHDTLKVLIKTIKDQRNIVCHEDVSLTPEDLKTKLKEFEITLKDALKEAETLYPNHKSALTALESDIDHSWGDLMIKVREELDPNSPGDYQLNKEEQEKFRPKATKCIQDKSRVELMAKLKSSSKVLLLDWLGRSEAIDPSNIAVSLQMAKDDKFHMSPLSSKPTIIDQKEILKAKDKSGNEATAVIISGDAGAGKSTLLSCVVEKWIKGKTDDFSGLCDYALLFYMEFRKSKFDNLDDYLQDLLLGVISEYDFRTVKSAIVDSCCIFLCDGFDERNKESVKLFQDILDLKAVNQKFLITTRPINTSDLTEIVNKCKKSRVNICLMGIPENSVIQAIQKLVKQRVPDVSQRQQMIDSLTETYHSMAPELKELTRIPLYNNLIFELMMEDPELRTSISTVTRLFAEIKKHDRKRLLNKFEHPDKESEMGKFEKLYRKISLKNHLDSKHEIDEMDIKMFKEECKTLEPYFGDIISAYFNTKHSVKSLDLEKVFCYKHRTEQEFAAAQAICDMLVNEDGVYDSVNEGNSGNIIMRCLSEVKPHDERSAEDTQKSVHNILVFVSGILHSLKLIDKYIRDIIDFVWLDLSQGNIDPLLDHLLEADNSTTVSEAISARLQDGNHDKWSVSKSKTMCSLTTLLSSHIKPKSLTFNVNYDPETNPHLIPAIRKASSQPIDIDLCMWWHYYGDISGNSDMFLYEAKSVKYFIGNLSLSGLSLIPDNIKMLWLQLDRQTLPAFWNHVTSLTELNALGLRIKLFFDPKDINPLPYKGYFLSILFDLEGRDGDTYARPCAEIMNSLWPRVQNSRHKKFLMLGTRWVPNMRSKEERRSQDNDQIYIDKSGFTSDGVEEFIRAVKVKNLGSIFFYDTVNITEEEKSRLCLLGRVMGLTERMIIF